MRSHTFLTSAHNFTCPSCHVDDTGATSHRRSCINCATAKRRCDLRLAQCSRCLGRDSDCSYANEPLSSSSNARLPPSRTTSEDGKKTPLDRCSDEFLSDIDFASFLIPDIVDQWSVSTTSELMRAVDPPASEAYRAHNGDRLAYLVTNGRSYPPTFVFQGRTPFIRSLYHGSLLFAVRLRRIAVWYVLVSKLGRLQSYQRLITMLRCSR